ncbi:hypothetical protein [Microbacterium sp. 13-71-7]|jgi:hypothetical protein|uniref:hypothetical protein n=1 Tax=Microbacterium sp. 13-71-7 TaxID=1970399 RepID=UPI000BD42BF3|nr:hypothetical protein [Microbacterium sp. 13-71-7]OZB85158.1 MAG: hypothetical protein B7X32_04500 [Microbacterium sp. 13-71-7]
MTDALEAWSEFHVAMLGATAALAGLVIVAASVNIGKIVAAKALTARLAAALAGLVLAILASGLALIPHIGGGWFGALVLIITAAAAGFQVHAALSLRHDPGHGNPVLRASLGFLPVAAYTAAGALLLAGQPAGLVLAATGSLLALVVAIVISWIALVEVLR